MSFLNFYSRILEIHQFWKMSIDTFLGLYHNFRLSGQYDQMYLGVSLYKILGLILVYKWQFEKNEQFLQIFGIKF